MSDVTDILNGKYDFGTLPKDLIKPLKIKLYQIQALLNNHKVEQASIILEEVLNKLREASGTTIKTEGIL